MRTNVILDVYYFIRDQSIASARINQNDNIKRVL